MMSSEVGSNGIERKSIFRSIILCKKNFLSTFKYDEKMSLPLLLDTPKYQSTEV